MIKNLIINEANSFIDISSFTIIVFYLKHISPNLNISCRRKNSWLISHKQICICISFWHFSKLQKNLNGPVSPTRLSFQNSQDLKNCRKWTLREKIRSRIYLTDFNEPADRSIKSRRDRTIVQAMWVKGILFASSRERVGWKAI